MKNPKAKLGDDGLFKFQCNYCYSWNTVDIFSRDWYYYKPIDVEFICHYCNKKCKGNLKIKE